MKSELLRILREAGDECVSGQSLCERFGVSRQAVWKNITQLKEKGFEIESVSNKGYKLKSEPDILNASAIESYLPKDCICKKAVTYDTIDSTNTKAIPAKNSAHRTSYLHGKTKLMSLPPEKNGLTVITAA